VGDGGIRTFEGNYKYYEWKKLEEKSAESTKPKVKKESKGKSDYKERKKIRNRLAWIEKRFNSIENELESQRAITQNPANGDKYELLQDAMNVMNQLELEYLELMEELERLSSGNR
jgi:archaellum component FlaC